MAIQYDKLTEALNALNTMRAEFTKGNLSVEELQQAEFVIKNEIREILGMPPIPPS